MGLEVGDGSVEPMADEVRSDNPVEAIIASCETLDLGDKAAEEKETVVADSNGHLTLTDEEGSARSGIDSYDAAVAPIESAPEESQPDETADVPEGFRSQGKVKNWSDFNAVSSHTFGDQSFGSFSDFLANQPDLPPDVPSQASAALELGSDVDFFEWGITAKDSTENVGMSGRTAPPAVVAEALSQNDQQPIDSIGSAIMAPEEPVPAPISGDEFFGFEQELKTTELPLEQTFVSAEAATATDAATAAAQSADPYPGWYYDYDVGEWRPAEGYNPIASLGSENAGYSADYVDSHSTQHMQPISEASAFQQETSHIPAAEQLQSWDSQSAATQTVADEYPNWKWDYDTQTWVASPDYSEPWQSTAPDTHAQGHGAEQSWYASQEQQTQTYGPAAASFADQPVASTAQSQSFMPGHVSDSANLITNGYPSSSANAANTGPMYVDESKQWPNNPAAGDVSNFYTSQMNGDRSWAAPAFNNQEQFGRQSMPSVSYPSSDAYYNYAPNGGPHNYAPQAWGNGPQYNQYQQYTDPNAPPPKNVHEALRTCSGRPPHSLAAFGFGGKFIFMKHRDPVTLHTSNGDQAFASGEAWMPGPIQVSNLRSHLPQESTFAGPLNGGGASSKELIKWIDERGSTQPTSLRLLLGVLKVACQHYGKLRSANVNSGNAAMEDDGPEAALAKLLAGAVGEQNPYAGSTRKNLALRGVPSEQLLQVPLR